jgi:hypothetical protein
VTSADVLHEGMPGDHDPGGAILLEPAQRTQPRLETAVVGFAAVVGVLIGAMPGSWQQLFRMAGYALSCR